jgi:hypothetical protein
MKLVYCLLVSLAASSAGAQKAFTLAEFRSLDWLQGTWKGSTGTKNFYEAWRWANDSTLVNFSIEIKDADTLVRETDALVLRSGRIMLGRPPAQWQATRLQKNELVLKNDTLRYSNTIIWGHTPDNHWLTVLEHPGSTVFYDLTKEAVLDRVVDKWVNRHTRQQKN